GPKAPAETGVPHGTPTTAIATAGYPCRRHRRRHAPGTPDARQDPGPQRPMCPIQAVSTAALVYPPRSAFAADAGDNEFCQVGVRIRIDQADHGAVAHPGTCLVMPLCGRRKPELFLTSRRI